MSTRARGAVGVESEKWKERKGREEEKKGKGKEGGEDADEGRLYKSIDTRKCMRVCMRV